MKKSLPVLVLGAGIVAVGAIAFFTQSPSPVATSVGDADHAGGADLSRHADVAPDKPKQDKRPAAPLERKMSIESVLTSDTRLIALSPDERDWLARHKFPSHDELNKAKSVPDDQLRSATTDPYAQTLWGMRLMERGRYMGAAAVLERAATRGSIYAYEQAAIAQLQDAKASGQLTTADANVFRARIEVARILGDHRAIGLVDQYLPNYNSAANARAVQQYTTEFMRQLGSSAQTQGITMGGPDPRPNAQLWADLQKLGNSGGGQDLTSVYDL